MIKAVFLDIDDTLLDFEAYVRQSMKDGFEKFHLGVFDESIYQTFKKINTQVWHELELGTLSYAELLKTRWNRVFAALNIDFDGVTFETYFKGCLFDSAIPVDGAMDILSYLQDRYLLCAASNGPYEQQVNRLKLGGMLPFFSHLFISEKIGHTKPAKEFFNHCLNAINADRAEKILPEEILMIGDSLTSDMAGAIGSGIKTCYFDKNHKGNPNHIALDHIISSLAEIRHIL